MECKSCGYRSHAPDSKCSLYQYRKGVMDRHRDRKLKEEKIRSNALAIAKVVVEMTPRTQKKDQRALILKRISNAYPSISLSERRKIARVALAV